MIRTKQAKCTFYGNLAVVMHIYSVEDGHVFALVNFLLFQG